jgi:hypothetical protein
MASGAVTRGAELTIALERLAHGFARLRLDPKTEETQEDLERRILELGSDGAWRTYKDYAGELGIRQTRAKKMLEALAEGEWLEVAVGPAGRSPKARCYRTEPARWEQSGSVTPYEPDHRDGATEPDVYRKTSAPGSVDGLSAEPGSVAVEEDEIERLAALARTVQT